MQKDRVVVAALMGWLFVGMLAAAPQFVPGPSARYSHSMAYDSARQVVVLFGGNTTSNWPSGALGDTWEWDGLQWTQVATTGPSPRGHGAMAYDAARGVCVLFGGTSNGAFMDDTWEWDGQSWSQVSSAASPSGRIHHSMSYDTVRQVTVLFGGRNALQLGAGHQNDTWEFDGITWVNIGVTGPSARSEAQMTYVPATGRHILFGGWNGSAYFNETWEWDGVAWVLLAPLSSPPARRTHGMCLSNGADGIVMFGGWNGGNRSDTWIWDGLSWSQVTSALVPPARHWVMNQMAFDEVSGQAIMFGGWNGSSLSDTWTFDGSAWSPELYVVTASSAAYGSGCGSPALTMSPSTPPLIGSVASATISNAPLAFGGVTLGFSNTALGGLPILPFSLTGLGMPGCFLWHSNEISGLPIVPVSPGVLSFSAAIPGNVSLLGTHVYLQAYCVDLNASPRKLITSNGVDWTIGNQ